MLKNNLNVRLNTVILHMFIHFTMGKSMNLMMQRYTATMCQSQICPNTSLAQVKTTDARIFGHYGCKCADETLHTF
jgi:hypothetical protein